jgi:hypothetical protein
MGNRRLYKIECLHMLGTLESERLKVTALNLSPPTASPLSNKLVFSYYDTTSGREGIFIVHAYTVKAGEFISKGLLKLR